MERWNRGVFEDGVIQSPLKQGRLRNMYWFSQIIPVPCPMCPVQETTLGIRKKLVVMEALNDR